MHHRYPIMDRHQSTDCTSCPGLCPGEECGCDNPAAAHIIQIPSCKSIHHLSWRWTEFVASMWILSEKALMLIKEGGTADKFSCFFCDRKGDESIGASFVSFVTLWQILRRFLIGVSENRSLFSTSLARKMLFNNSYSHIRIPCEYTKNVFYA